MSSEPVHIPDEDEDFYADDDIYDITSWGADISFRELIRQYDEGELLKPEIQRKYIWTKPEASRFIDSILMGLPVPSVFLAKTKDEKKLIVDGFQRIMTVRDFVDGVFSQDKSVFKLSNTERINERWRGKSFKQLSEIEQRRIQNTTIHAIIFQQQHPQNTNTSLYQIFERINTGGRILLSQEIRNCVYHGNLNKLLIELNKTAAWRKLYGEEDQRMRDMEFILRFFALASDKIKKSELQQISLKKVLNLFMGDDENNKESSITRFRTDFLETMEFVWRNFGEHAFHNLSPQGMTYVENFHPTVFDSVAIATFYALKKTPKRDFENLENRKLKLLRDPRFIEYSTRRTTKIPHINGRISLALEYLYGLRYE